MKVGILLSLEGRALLRDIFRKPMASLLVSWRRLYFSLSEIKLLLDSGVVNVSCLKIVSFDG